MRILRKPVDAQEKHPERSPPQEAGGAACRAAATASSVFSLMEAA